MNVNESSAKHRIYHNNNDVRQIIDWFPTLKEKLTDWFEL